MGVLFPKTYPYKQYTGSNRIKGRITTVYNPILQSFTGNVQPMSQFEVESLDIGRHNLGKIKVYTDKVFTISKENEANTGDKVVYDNNDYEIIGLDNHTGNLLPHRKYIGELRLNDNLAGNV